MSHKDAPPETPSQIACREWWTNAQPHVTRAWGRAKNGAFLAEESRLLHAAWEHARVPDGWALVPEICTDSMFLAGDCQMEMGAGLRGAWERMVANAPSATEGESHE